jgi:hypothetical protein
MSNTKMNHNSFNFDLIHAEEKLIAVIHLNGETFTQDVTAFFEQPNPYDSWLDYRMGLQQLQKLGTEKKYKDIMNRLKGNDEDGVELPEDIEGVSFHRPDNYYKKEDKYPSTKPLTRRVGNEVLQQYQGRVWTSVQDYSKGIQGLAIAVQLDEPDLNSFHNVGYIIRKGEMFSYNNKEYTLDEIIKLALDSMGWSKEFQEKLLNGEEK